MSGERHIGPGRVSLFDFAADFVALLMAYYTTLMIRFHSEWGERLFTAINRLLNVRETGSVGDRFQIYYTVNAPRIILFVMATLYVLYALKDLYSGRRFIRSRPVAWNIVVSNTAALGVFFAYFYLRRNIFHPRSFFVTLLALNAAYGIWMRALVAVAMDAVRRRFGLEIANALLVGSGDHAQFLKIFISEIHPHGVRIDRHITAGRDEPIDAVCTKVRDAVRERSVDMIIVAENRLSVNDIMQMLLLAGELRVPVKVLSDKLMVLMNQARLPMDVIQGIPLVHFNPPRVPGIVDRLQHAGALLAASVLFALLLPLFGIIALLIRLTSPGRVFFVQERIGVNRKPFRMFKFRTMYNRAEELQAQLEEFNEAGDGHLFKMRRDPRVTPVGRMLRRFSLDELPQLINIIRGDMNLVGPRPLPRRDFKNYYETWHYSRHEGRPGLTCLWQVSGRSELNFQDMCLLDVYYLRNRNWALDVKIVMRTIIAVLFGRGAY